MKVVKKNLLCWIIYDFGNSFFTVAIGAMFLAQWLILDNKVPDIRYGASFSLATVFVLIVSPVLGARSDRIGRRMPFLISSTIGLIIVNGLVALVALSSLPNKVWIVLGLSVAIQFLYQVSLVFYNALLKNVSQENNRGVISGIGEGMGGLGWIAALFIFLPIANGAFAFMGTEGRHLVFLPSFILSTLFMLPMLLRFKEKRQPIIQTTQNIYKKTWTGIKQLWTTQKNVGLYLLAFSLISDIVLTMTLYLAIVMDVVYKAGEKTKSIVLVLFLLVGIIFGYIFGKIADKFGYKKILVLTCFVLIINCILFFSCSAPRVLYIVGVVGGIASGGYFSITKAFMVKISPTEELGEYFGLYSSFHKAASITAPLIRGGITLWLIQYPVLKYQVAGAAMTVLLIIGTILMMRVKENNNTIWFLKKYMQIQLDHLYTHWEKLQKKHGEKTLFAIHGAGCIKKPDICFVFMNPTGKNVSAVKERKGIRAPRLGTKNVRKIFFATNIISKTTFDQIQKMKANDWTEEFAEQLYREIAAKKVYITNLAKCTQADARPLKDKVFKDYLSYTMEEIALLQPKYIIPLGNQVSSVLLNKPIKVSEYKKNEYETLTIKNTTYKVYPTYYPVGQGMRNMPQAIQRIQDCIRAQ